MSRKRFLPKLFDPEKSLKIKKKNQFISSMFDNVAESDVKATGLWQEDSTQQGVTKSKLLSNIDLLRDRRERDDDEEMKEM